jgi:hypothetical protein
MPTLVTGDYASLLYGDKIPARGTAVMGTRLYENGEYLGLTVSTPTRPAFETVLEPRGEYMLIHYVPEAGA